MRKVLLLLILALPVLACGGSATGSGGGVEASPPVFRVISANVGTSTYGRTEVTVRATNDSGRLVEGVRINVDCYDGGTLIATEWMPADPYDVAAGAEVIRSVRFAEGVTCDNVKARITARR